MNSKSFEYITSNNFPKFYLKLIFKSSQNQMVVSQNVKSRINGDPFVTRLRFPENIKSTHAASELRMLRTYIPLFQSWMEKL